MALSECNVATDERDRELKKHGTDGFPVACYHDDLRVDCVPWHWHEEWEAAIVERGECLLSTGTGDVILKEGEGLFLNAGVLHMCDRAGADKDCILQSVVFSPSLIGGSAGTIFWKKYLTPLLQNPGFRLFCFQREIGWEEEALRHIENAWNACAREPISYEVVMRNELSSVIALLAENIPPVCGGVPASDVRCENRIKQMLEYIREHYAEELDAKCIAASANVSESEALRCFKKMLGTTPNRYLISYRLEKAEQLLAATNLRISEIGERCGFHEMSYFSRVFHKKNGCTPKVYRSELAD